MDMSNYNMTLSILNENGPKIAEIDSLTIQTEEKTGYFLLSQDILEFLPELSQAHPDLLQNSTLIDPWTSFFYRYTSPFSGFSK